MPEKVDVEGRKKAAILLVSLGTENAIKIFKHFSEEEIEQLTMEIANISLVDNDLRKQVLEEFSETCFEQKFTLEGGVKYVQEILERSIGTQKALDIISKLTSTIQIKPFEFIRRADPNQVLNFVQYEHPQTIALIFSYLKPQQAAFILSALPKEKQSEVAIRIAMMEKTSPDVINQVERVMERKFNSIGAEAYTSVGGIKAIVDILNAVDRSTEKNILESMESSNSEIAESIRKQLFVFEDITKLDSRSIQLFLKDIENNDLALALKGATNEVSEVIFANMSKRVQEMIKEDMEVMGPVRLRDVEEAQQKIVATIRKLEDTGEIIVSRGGGEEILV